MARDKALAATHLFLLTRAFDVSQGDVLEIGTGYYSTYLLHLMSEVTKRKVYSYDNVQKWYDKAKRYQSENHHIELIDNWDKLDFGDKHWGLIFVDHGPVGRRVEEIKKFADKCDYMVIHDTEPQAEGAYRYSTIWHLFKYRVDDKRFGAWTSIVSNKYDLK